MGDAKVDVVDHARHRIEIAAVGPDQYGIGQRRRIDMLPPAHEVVPHYVSLLQQKAPMRLASLRLEPRAIRRCELQGGAVINGRLAAGELALPLQLELLRRLVSRIKPPARFQLLDRLGITVEPVRLAHFLGPFDAEPMEILLDAAREFLRRALPIGIVQAEDQPAACPPREQMIEHRRADIAGMDPPRGARREADSDAHA